MNKYILVKAGIDVNAGIERFNGSQEMYEEFLTAFSNEKQYQLLIFALEQKDVKSAFKEAHALKGLSGNLSMTELHEALVPLVEELRIGSMENADVLMEKVTDKYMKVMNALKQSE